MNQKEDTNNEKEVNLSSKNNESKNNDIIYLGLERFPMKQIYLSALLSDSDKVLKSIENANKGIKSND